MFRLLFVGLFTGLWLSLKEARCQTTDNDVRMSRHCYNTSSGNTCFTIFVKDSHPMRQTFEAARLWCNSSVPGSSLIRINSLEGQRTVESFIEKKRLSNEIIVIDAQRISGKDSLEWSWANGHPTVPESFNNKTSPGLDVGLVYAEPKHGHSLVYIPIAEQSKNRYICEYEDSKSTFSYRQNKSHYFASNGSATWYDARNECLQSGGDLASIRDFNTIGNWSWLNGNERYWIGLHRNKWIWNNTGVALTYTNWKGGYPDEAVSDNKCICIDTKCRSENSETICDFDRKWNTCNCEQNYAVVCQTEENFDASTSESVVTEVTHQSIITHGEPEISFASSANATSTSTKISIASIITTTSTKPSTASTSIPTTSSANPSTAAIPITATSSTKTTTATTQIETIGTSFTETVIAPSRSTAITEMPSTGLSLFQSFGKKEILIAVLLLVTVVFIIVAVILFIRKRKRDKRNATSPTENTKQDEAITSVYATVVPSNKPPGVTTPAASPTYAEVVKTQEPTPSNTTYAEVQMTQQPGPSNTTYAEVQMTQQPGPSNSTYAEVQMTKQPGPSYTTYAEVTHQPESSNNTYAEVVMTQQPTPSNNHIYANFQPTTNEAADIGSGVVYAGLDFSPPNGKAVDEPIYLQAMDVKAEAESGEDAVATQDLGPVYAESTKLKKSD